MFGRLLKTAAPVCFVLACCLTPLSGAVQKEQSVSLSTQDGWALAALYLPADSGKKTVVLLHDLGKNKEEFSTFKSDLAREGFGYLAVDLRGHGQSTGQGLAYTFAKEGVDNQYNKMTRDVDAAVSFLRKKAFGRRYRCAGRGPGGQCGRKKHELFAGCIGAGAYQPHHQ